MIRDKLRLAEIKKMKKNGMTNEQIADLYKLSHQRISQLLAKIGNEEKLKEMAVLREIGWTLPMIGKKYGMDKRRVSEWLSKYNFPRRKCIYCGKWFVPTSAIRHYDSIMHKRAMLAAHRRYHKQEEASDDTTRED